MEWVDGNTLDVYVGALIKQKKAKGHLKPLAEQWSELVCKLESTDVAHGDLQHGNVIVTPSGFLKLVDLDGMYVPALNGRQTTELGHIHFQHPNRGQAPFDKRLDHFSSLVIYTSLLALDHDPSLWDQFHDDNLILAKGDFADPARSKLIKLMKQQGGEVARLTDALVTACSLRSPATVPSLASLVQVKHSKLPAWMRPSAVVTVETKTREATATVGPPSGPSPTMPAAGATPASAWATTQTTAPSAAASVAGAGTSASDDWVGRGLKRGFKFAVYWWWTGLLASQILLNLAQGLGATAEGAWFPAILMYLTAFLALGLVIEVRSRSRTAPLSIRSTAAPAPATQTRSAPVQTPAAIPTRTVIVQTSKSTTVPPRVSTATRSVPAPASTSQPRIPMPVVTPTRAGITARVGGPSKVGAGSSAGHVIASSIRMIYHRPGCEYASKISLRNRVLYGSTQDAIKYGCRPCRICNP